VCAPIVSAQTADEVLEKSVAAQGGRTALTKIRSRTTSGTIALQTPGGEISGSIDVYNKTPNKTRSVIKVDLSQFGAGNVAIDQRFDGTSGYVIDPLQGNRDLAGGQLENLKNGSFPSAFLDYKERGATATLLPKAQVLGKEAFVVQLAPKTGPSVKNYIDADSYMVVRTVVTVNVAELNQDVESTVDFSDFKSVDGVKVPFTIRLSSAVQNYTVTLSKVEHNAELDEAMFKKP
ncbi:MAG TPA: hypothetical protein VEU08_07625, partial [Vicinamibacterales bacterium]|nr:hypothetical protein [Vicinamibacterales bacterium]